MDDGSVSTFSVERVYVLCEPYGQLVVLVGMTEHVEEASAVREDVEGVTESVEVVVCQVASQYWVDCWYS